MARGGEIPGQVFNGGRAGAAPTGRGGAQPREWYRGLPIPPEALQNFSRRDNTNYMETGVLSGLQLTSMFPNLVLQNFYEKTQHSIDAGKTQAPYGYVIPFNTKDMTRAVALVNVLRAQAIEIGEAKSEVKIGDTTYPAGSYIVEARSTPPLRPASPRTCSRSENYPDPQPDDLRRQRLDDGARDGRGGEGDQGTRRFSTCPSPP